MSSVRDARRALARGNVDEALVVLWNAIEPLRLDGDVAGLDAVARMAEAIAQSGDGSQAREARRLLGEIEALSGQGEEAAGAFVESGARDGASVPAGPEPSILVETGYAGDEATSAPDGDDEPRRAGTEPEPRRRSRTASLIWALILGAFVLFNIVRGIVGD